MEEAMPDRKTSFPILIVDDSPEVVKRLKIALGFEGFVDVHTCTDPLRAVEAAELVDAALVVLDLKMEGKSGMEILGELRVGRPGTSVIVATAINDLDNAIECMRLGAFDYVPKSAETSRLIASVRHALSIRELREDYAELKSGMLSPGEPLPEAFERIVSGDPRMIALLRYVGTVAKTDKAILVTGESGTGKELVAEAIHRCSGRTGPIVTVNIAGLDDAMFSDALFGHRKGAYTGADSDRDGLVERASGGTLFLDEIGDLPVPSQVKLLRLIEEKRYYQLGADLPKATDAAVVAATNRDLWKECERGAFRKDLYFRLQTHLVELPPLRERKRDIPALAELFVARAAEKFGKKPPRIPHELLLLLEHYDFPGNVRELESLMHDAVGRCEGQILPLEPFRAKIAPKSRDALGLGPLEDLASSVRIALQRLPTLPSLREAQMELIREALARAKGNQGIAASLIGISRTALNRRLKGLDE
jgi:DNA-binding NtrC family response regulator